MTLRELVRVAGVAYPDGLVLEAFDARGGSVGDGLAEFVASELRDTYDPEGETMGQICEAIRAMRRAEAEVGEVIEALHAEYTRRLDARVPTKGRKGKR